MRSLCLLLTCAVVLTGCSRQTQENWGLAKKAPNEFMVAARQPLTLPPDYDLRPVNANMGKTNSATDRNSAGLTAGEQRLLEKVDAQ